jgi:repressor LexA
MGVKIMNTGERIKHLRDSYGLSQEGLGKILGVDRTTIVKWETGASRPTRSLKRLAHYFNVTTDYILGREDIGLYELKDTKRVPVIGTVRCGAGGVAYEYIDEYITIDDTYRPDEMRGFRAEGDSMEPEIHDGDICLVHLQEEVPDGALAVVVICDGVEEGEGTIKRIHKADGAVILQATNPDYPPRIFTGEKANRVKIVGRVVEVRHKTI